jgi:hypothetical protein
MILDHVPTEGSWRDAFPLALGNHPVLAEEYYARPKDLWHPVWGPRFDRVRTAFFDWPLKLIESSDGRHELYDLAGDPREATSLLVTREEAAVRLAKDLDRFRAARGTAEGPEAPPARPEDLEALRALGYLGE